MTEEEAAAEGAQVRGPGQEVGLAEGLEVIQTREGGQAALGEVPMETGMEIERVLAEEEMIVEAGQEGMTRAMGQGQVGQEAGVGGREEVRGLRASSLRRIKLCSSN